MENEKEYLESEIKRFKERLRQLSEAATIANFKLWDEAARQLFFKVITENKTIKQAAKEMKKTQTAARQSMIKYLIRKGVKVNSYRFNELIKDFRLAQRLGQTLSFLDENK